MTRSTRAAARVTPIFWSCGLVVSRAHGAAVAPLFGAVRRDPDGEPH
jgi:hypothetical protein